jgi:hypothetical protein
MTWTNTRTKNDWRSYLTETEEIEISVIEAKMQAIDAKRRELTTARQLIQNRATTRFRYQKANK